MQIGDSKYIGVTTIAPQHVTYRSIHGQKKDVKFQPAASGIKSAAGHGKE